MRFRFISLFIVAFFTCKKTDAQFPYTLDQPDEKYKLPELLNEVSGITDIDNQHLALVQDELGLVFIFHLPSGKVINQFPFDSIGDFEGITYTGEAVFILRSDGRLTEWSNFNRNIGGTHIQHHTLPVLTKDNEGLCFDKQNNKLLIAAKSNPADARKKTERFIYSFDPDSHQFLVETKYSLNTEELALQAKKFCSPAFNINSKGKTKSFNFRPSSLAFHPVTGYLYVLSAADQLLIILDNNGNVHDMASLNSNLFPQAEGITFLDNGTMIISNEADGKVATLLTFDMK